MQNDNKISLSYLRVSGKGQIEGGGFDRQRNDIAAFAKREGFEIQGEFIDAGVSGTKDGFDRDGLSDLLAYAQENSIKYIIAENASRIARDLMIQEVILADCRKKGITVFDTSGNDLTVSDGDPTRCLIRQILGAVAQFEKETTVRKLRAARIRKRMKNGKCEGAKGYKELNPEIRELAKQKRAEGMKLKDIAHHLGQKGFQPKRAKAWSVSQVQGLLR